jgi:hypothetical protein
MNPHPIEPAPNPEDAKRQQPHPNTGPLQGLPPPANPNADIGKEVAEQNALKLAVAYFKANNAKVIHSSVMSYKDGLLQVSESIAEDDPLANTLVRLIEMSGTFKRRRHPRWWENESASHPAFTKGYIILRAADGYLLHTKLIVDSSTSIAS